MFAPPLHYQLSKTCSRHIFSRVPTLLTNFFADYEQRTLYSALVVTLAMLLRLIKCRFIDYYFCRQFYAAGPWCEIAPGSRPMV